MFRLSAKLQHPVRLAQLEEAVGRLYNRAPYLAVRIRRGLFWHYLEETDPPGPLADTGFPCMEHPGRAPHHPLLVVRCRGSRVALEVSHALTDGGGALVALRSLLVMYRAACMARDGAPPEEIAALENEARDDGLLAAGDEIQDWEGRYASREVGRARTPAPSRYTPAWHIDGALLPPGRYRVTTVRYPVGDLQRVARALGGTLTDLGIAVFLEVLQDHYLEQWRPRRKRRPLRIMVPVDLRRHLNRSTMRNFFGITMVELDQRLGRYALEEIMHTVHHQLRAALDPRVLRKQIVRNIRAERNWLNRVMPIFLKIPVLRMVHRLQGETVNTASFSNLGVVHLPRAAAQDVQSMDFVPLPSPVTGVNLAFISFGDTASFTFGSMRGPRTIEQRFCARLAALGLTGYLVTNDAGGLP